VEDILSVEFNVIAEDRSVSEVCAVCASGCRL